jgi:hypothetical protein
MQFEAALKNFLSIIDKACQEYDTRNYAPGDEPYFKPLQVEEGRKFLRIVATHGAGRNVYCFVEKETGRILKAASWKAPAKGGRGSIFEPQKFEKLPPAALAFTSWLYAR